jgi:hypothetical protein
MRHRLTGAVGAGLVLALGTSPPVAGQVRGIPVYNSGVAKGIAVYGDVGFTNDAAVKGTGLAVSGRLGFGRLGTTAILSTFNPDGASGSNGSLGATLNYKIFGGPLVPLSVTLQGGIGYAKPDSGFLPTDDVTELRFPVGAGFALTIPNPALAIRPWIAPRVDIIRGSASDTSKTVTHFGLGAGLELNLLNGFGLHAAYDRVFTGLGDPTVFAVGAHYAFGTPGL